MKKIKTLDELLGVVGKLKDIGSSGYWIFPIHREVLSLKEHELMPNIWTKLPNEESVKIVEVKRGYLLVAYSKEGSMVNY